MILRNYDPGRHSLQVPVKIHLKCYIFAKLRCKLVLNICCSLQVGKQLIMWEKQCFYSLLLNAVVINTGSVWEVRLRASPEPLSMEELLGWCGTAIQSGRSHRRVRCYYEWNEFKRFFAFSSNFLFKISNHFAVFQNTMQTSGSIFWNSSDLHLNEGIEFSTTLNLRVGEKFEILQELN